MPKHHAFDSHSSSHSKCGPGAKDAGKLTHVDGALRSRGRSQQRNRLKSSWNYLFFPALILSAVFSFSLAVGQAEALDQYRIGGGDMLEIVTWKEPDFSREVLVRTDGKITFPLIGDIQAAGLAPQDLKRELEAGLKKYIAAPIVTVNVKTPDSQKFYVLGEVKKTGEYNLLKNLTVLQAFALAEGFTEWASKKEIIVLRRENGKDKIIKINYKNIVKGEDLSQNIKIQADDTIIVP